MKIIQNYELIDQAKLSKLIYIKIHKLTDQVEDHYTVSWYYNSSTIKEQVVNQLIACDHFIGPMAEVEALNNFIGYVEPLDFPVTPAKHCSSCKAERSYRNREVIKELLLESVLLT